MLCPLHCIIHDNPTTIFASDPQVVLAVTMLFCAVQHISSGLRGLTGFILRIISHWDAIHWEGEMFYDLSEVDLGFGHFMRYCLEVLQGDASGY